MKIITLIFLNHCDLNGEPIVKKMAVSRTVTDDLEFGLRQLSLSLMTEKQRKELHTEWMQIIGLNPAKRKNTLKTA